MNQLYLKSPKRPSTFSVRLSVSIQILTSVASMRLYVAPTGTARTGSAPSDASATRATRRPRMATAVWASSVTSDLHTFHSFTAAKMCFLQVWSFFSPIIGPYQLIKFSDGASSPPQT